MNQHHLVIPPAKAAKLRTRLNLFAAFCTVTFSCLQATAQEAQPAKAKTDVVRFNRDVRPILSATCFHCHGPDEHGRMADLRLDNFSGATSEENGSPAIVPGSLNESEAWLRITSTDDDLKMPPPESKLELTDAQADVIRRWIEQGAEYEGHWAFTPPSKPTVPQTQIKDANGMPWGHNEIDSFIAANLMGQRLHPAAEAKPRQLLRRLSFDLLGLPPTLDELQDFEQDYQSRGEAAWQDAITRMLSSRHFGERMAVPWLDQARYADTNGYSIDGGREMWLWRDWVIEAYNSNMPFDQFLTEQLAGDLLPNASTSQLIASGFNRNHMITHEGGTIPLENLTNYTADRVKTTSEVFLGLTMGCAQCHDHKYDPISQKEYYQFFAFFNELDDRGLDGNAGRNSKPSIMAQTVLPKDEIGDLQTRLASAKQELAETEVGFNEWLSNEQRLASERGNGFRSFPVDMLDCTSPNRPGAFSINAAGVIDLPQPSRGLNAFSHSIRIPDALLETNQKVSGVRLVFEPKDTKTGMVLTPFDEGVPLVTAVLASASDQPAKQVDYYSQIQFSQATASSFVSGHEPGHVLDERNIGWWKAKNKSSSQHLTLTFKQPLNPSENRFLTLLVFFGKNGSLPFRWRVEAFIGVDDASPHPASVSEALALSPANWTAEQKQLIRETYCQQAPQLEGLRTRIANLEDRLTVLNDKHQTMVMNQAAKPRETFVLDRGQYDAPGERVTAGTPAVLPRLEGEDLTRLDLANWMTLPENPLVSRVAVNRLWSTFFGKGIVATSADFGSQGQYPSHPELLDFLATRFVESGWDQKALIRLIVSSATYRQSSDSTAEQLALDPSNDLLARGPRFRLPAEFIRDQALSLSNLLVKQIGGPSVQPYQPPSLWKEVSHFGSTPATKQVFTQDHGEKLYRRSLYTIVKRTSPHPAMSAFDAPNREMCIVERGSTNTPLQALVTLNDVQFAECARVLAQQILSLKHPTRDAHLMKDAFEVVTGRMPNETELATLLELLEAEREVYKQDELAAQELLSVGESEAISNDAPLPEQAAWTQVVTVLMNLSEVLTRN